MASSRQPHSNQYATAQIYADYSPKQQALAVAPKEKLRFDAGLPLLWLGLRVDQRRDLDVSRLLIYASRTHTTHGDLGKCCRT